VPAPTLTVVGNAAAAPAEVLGALLESCQAGLAACFPGAGVTGAERAAAAGSEASELARRLEDPGALALALALSGEALLLLARAEESRSAFEEGLSVAAARGDHRSAARCRLGLAQLALREGRATEARVLAERAIASAARSRERPVLAEAMLVFSSLLPLPAEGPRALLALARALSTFDGLGARRQAMACELALCKIHEALGEFREALRHQRGYAQRLVLALEESAKEASSRLPVRALEAAQRELIVRDVELAEAHHALAETQRQVEHLRRHDPLTGLASRSAFSERAEEEFARARRFGAPLALVRLHLEGLAGVEDLLSRAVADEVRAQAGRLLAARLRSIDLSARWSEDGFALLLPETGEAGARLVCEKLAAALGTVRLGELAPDLEVSASVGFACGTDHSGWELLLAAADANLIRARGGSHDGVWGPSKGSG
jgi:diguanylate cyclase (GGDEF)-like protein